MATLIDVAEFTVNEVYQISQLDPLEGAASGASFGGTGIDNQPHQQLANRTYWLYGQVNTLNSQVAAINARLVKSGGYHIYATAPGTNLVANNSPITIINFNYTFPGSSPTGSFCLFAQVSIGVRIPAQSNTLNLGVAVLTLFDRSTNSLSFNGDNLLVVAGTNGATFTLKDYGWFLNSNGYAPNQTINIQGTASLQTAAIPVSQLTVTTVDVTVFAVPF
jgi:hypothetical protein